MKSTYFIAALSALSLGGCVVGIGGDHYGVSMRYTVGGAGYGSVYAANVEAITRPSG